VINLVLNLSIRRGPAPLLASLNFRIPIQNKPFLFSPAYYNNVYEYISQTRYFFLSQYLSKYLFLLLLLCRVKMKAETGLGLAVLSLQ
jgi:hypothetical protein